MIVWTISYHYGGFIWSTFFLLSPPYPKLEPKDLAYWPYSIGLCSWRYKGCQHNLLLLNFFSYVNFNYLFSLDSTLQISIMLLYTIFVSKYWEFHVVFRLRDQDFSSSNIVFLKRAISQYFRSSSLSEKRPRDANKELVDPFSSDTRTNGSESTGPELFLLPVKAQDELQISLFGSYISMLGQLRDQVFLLH